MNPLVPILSVNNFKIRKLQNGFTLEYTVAYENGDGYQEIFVENREALVDEFKKAIDSVHRAFR